MDSTQQAKVAVNESNARDANAKLLTMQDDAPERFVVVCECWNEDCARFLDVPVDVVLATREHPARFLLYPDESHFLPGAGMVVEKMPGWWVVEKIETAREVAVERAGESPVGSD